MYIYYISCLSQMYAQRYGTVPVVHATGGLKDSVVQYDPFADAAVVEEEEEEEATRNGTGAAESVRAAEGGEKKVTVVDKVCMYVCTHTHTQTHTNTHKHTNTQTHRHTDTEQEGHGTGWQFGLVQLTLLT
jgi:hypothetical protein